MRLATIGREPGPSAAGDGGTLGAPSWLDVACAVNAAWNALTYVCIPGLLLDVVSLGLIYDVRGDNDAILVEMALPQRGWVAGRTLLETVSVAVISALAGQAAVKVRVVQDPPWSTAMIDTAAAVAAGLRLG